MTRYLNVLAEFVFMQIVNSLYTMYQNYRKTLDILYSVGCDIIDGVVIPGQDRVVVASDAG